MTIWSLTTDTDNGIDTELYPTEVAAYKALADEWFHREGDGRRNEHPDVKRKRDFLAALEISVATAHEWMDNYLFDSDSDDRYIITRHEYEVPAKSEPTYKVLDDRAVATILHGLRMIQENANGPGDCVAGCCDHFDEADELLDPEIDALCESLNLDSVAILGGKR